MSPNTKRSPATVPERLATSSALPVTSPVAKRLAKCDGEFSATTASATRRDNSSSRVIFLSRASSTKLLASSASPQASAASMFCATTAGFSRRAESIWRSESSAGSSCVESKAPASRACGHSAASTAALTARPPRAEPSRRHFTRKTRYLHHPEVKIVCPYYAPTAATKERRLSEAKLCSNLEEQ